MVGPNAIEEGTTDTKLGKNNVERTTEVENVADEGDILDKGAIKSATMVDERDKLDKGTLKMKLWWMKETFWIKAPL